MKRMETRDQRGFTIVELMIAMVLMAVALLALAASFPYAVYGIVLSGVQTTATFLAQEAIERARAADYESLGSLRFDGAAGASPGDCDAGGSFRPVTAVAGFARCVSVRIGTPTPATTTITVVVEFTETGVARPWRTTMTTIRGR